MVSTGTERGRRLRAVVPPEQHAHRLTSGELFERGGQLVWRDRRLSQLATARPSGVTTHQWNSATRTHFDFVVCDRHDGIPRLGVCFDDPSRYGPDAERGIRIAHIVCEAVGLPVLRIESPTLRADGQGRRIVEYVLDARAFSDTRWGAAGVWDVDSASELDDLGDVDPSPGYRDIVGRLPDGRSGFVNDLGAVARGAAVQAYVVRQVADPIIRGLHVAWADGVAEGWAWLTVRDGRYLFERVRLWLHHYACGVEAGRLAEDLAVVAIGERLKTLELTEPVLRDRERLADDLTRLRGRRAEMATPFAFDHVSFD